MAKTKNLTVPSHLWVADSKPPHLCDVLSQVAHFFEKLGYSRTLDSLIADAKEKGVTPDAGAWERGLNDTSATLMQLWAEWRTAHGSSFPTLPASSSVKKEKKAVKKEESSSEEESESDSSGEEDESSDESDDEETEGKKAGMVDDEAESTSDDSSDGDSSSDEDNAKVGTKRKRVMTPDSSSEEDESSGDDSSSDSSGREDVRPAKRAKNAPTDDSSSDASEDDSSSASEAEGGMEVDDTSASDHSSSDSDSGSGSDGSSDGSDSSASDDASSESESAASPPPKKKSKKAAKPVKASKASKDANDSSTSSSSATLTATSPTKPNSPDELLIPTNSLPEESSEPTAGMHPDRLRRMPATAKNTNDQQQLKRVPATEENVAQLKKSNVPFSRIPKDTFVDPKFASNNYVPYDYADKAFQDLSVTKGKGFTKEKNKKKRGELLSNTPSKKPQPKPKRRERPKFQPNPKPESKAQQKKGPLQGDALRRRKRKELISELGHEAFETISEHESDIPDFGDEYNPMGFKDDMFDFMSGCGFDPMGGGW